LRHHSRNVAHAETFGDLAVTRKMSRDVRLRRPWSAGPLVGELVEPLAYDLKGAVAGAPPPAGSRPAHCANSGQNLTPVPVSRKWAVKPISLCYGMAALARTPVLPELTLVGVLSAQLRPTSGRLQ
jgi:hypothetical protein